MKNRIAGAGPWAGAVLFFWACLSLSPSSACAHPPKNVVLAYDMAAQNLTVEITHKSSFPNWHYIKKVTIKKNGQEMSVQAYKNQPSQATFDYAYPAVAVAGDILEVTAVCSLMGSKTTTLTVGEPAAK